MPVLLPVGVGDFTLGDFSSLVDSLTKTAGITLAAFQAWSSYDLQQQANKLRRDEIKLQKAIALEQLAAIKQQLETEQSGGQSLDKTFQIALIVGGAVATAYLLMRRR